MSEVIKAQKIWLGGYDLSGKTNALKLGVSINQVDATTLGDDTKNFMPGIKVVSVGASGLVDPSNLDKVIFDKLSESNIPLSYCTQAPTAGNSAYSLRASTARYEISGQMGDAYQYDMEAAATGDLVRGKVLANLTAITATGDSASITMPAVSSNQKLYAILHVFKADGTTPTLDVIVESDATDTFGGGETTRITFDQVTGIGAQWKEITGPITDTFYRAGYTVSGTSPDFDFTIILAVQ